MLEKRPARMRPSAPVQRNNTGQCQEEDLPAPMATRVVVWAPSPGFGPGVAQHAVLAAARRISFPPGRHRLAACRTGRHACGVVGRTRPSYRTRPVSSAVPGLGHSSIKPTIATDLMIMARTCGWPCKTDGPYMLVRTLRHRDVPWAPG